MIFKRNFRISTKLLITVVVFLIVPIILLLSISYSTTEKIIYNNIGSLTKTNINQLNNKIQSYAGNLREASSIMFFDGKLINLLQYYTDGSFDSIYFNIDGTKNINDISDYDYLLLSNEFDNIFNSIQENILTKDCHIGVFANNGTLFSTWPSYLTDNDFFTNHQIYEKAIALKGTPFYIGPHENYLDNRQDKFFSYVKLINDDNNINKWYGILIVSIPINQLNDIIYDSQVSQMANILITDENGNEITYINNHLNYTIPASKIYQSPHMDKDISHFTLEHLDEKYLINANTINILRWKVISIIPYDIMFHQVYTLRHTVLSISVFIIALCIVLTSMSIYKITKPLNQLKNAMKTVQTGNLDLVLPNINNNDDEISILTSTFNRMLQNINNLIKKIALEEKKEAELRFEMLMAQINPHFLFNTLNSIKWMALMSRANNVSDAISALGRLLEISMNKQNDIITVREELENLKNYIFIQKIRYKETFQINYDISDNILHYETLKLILQPIVENAIIHNAQKADRLINISVAACRKDNLLIYTIKDDGYGFSGDIITLSENKADQKRKEKVFSGIGLINVHDRIQLKYGDNFGIEINSSTQCTVITIRHPALIKE